MANLIRRDIFDDLFDVRQTFDRMLRNRFTGLEWPSERSAWALFGGPPIEAWIDKDGKNYHLKVALPGVDPKDVQVELQGDNLMVRGEHHSKEGKKGTEYLQREFSYGRFERVVALPEGTETSKLAAEYNNGMLEVTVPLSEAGLPKPIEVKITKAKGTGA